VSDLEMFVVYERPLDFPDSFVVRRWTVVSGAVTADPLPIAIGLSLDEVRSALPAHLECVGRAQHDDPVIREVWL